MVQEDELDHIGEMGDEEDQPPVEPGDDEEDEGNNEDLGEVGGMGYENVTAIDKEKEYGKEFDMILAKVRTKRKRSSKPSAEPGGEKEKTPDAPDLQTFILHMESACERDGESMKKKRPALSKLQMLPQVINMLQKDFVREGQFDSNLLRACYMWLKPLPDGSLPNQKIRDGILKNLLRIDVSQDALQSSSLGKVVMILSKHPKETEANRRVCRELVSKWLRPIFYIQQSFRSSEEETLDGARVVRGDEGAAAAQRNADRRVRRHSSGPKLDEVLETDTSSKSEKPQKLGKLYFNRPDKVHMDYPKAPDSNWTKPGAKKQEKKLKVGIHESMATLKARPTAKRAVDVGISRVPSNIV